MNVNKSDSPTSEANAENVETPELITARAFEMVRKSNTASPWFIKLSSKEQAREQETLMSLGESDIKLHNWKFNAGSDPQTNTS